MRIKIKCENEVERILTMWALPVVDGIIWEEVAMGGGLSNDENTEWWIIGKVSGAFRPAAPADKDAELVRLAHGKTDNELSALVLGMRANGSLKSFCKANGLKGQGIQKLQWAAYDFLKDIRNHLALSF